MRNRILLFVLLVIPGMVGTVIFGWSALRDWGQLQAAYARFEHVAASDAGLREVFVAYAKQEIHRTNLFADGVWMLLSAILAAIGVHGLCVGRSHDR